MFRLKKRFKGHMRVSNILVVGSSNTDMVVMSERIPGPGETVIGGSFFMNPGGKGANQAVAAARAGGKVVFVCKVGDDVFGSQAVQHFEESGIDTSFITVDEVQASGVALINVDRQGENSIAVASGANSFLRPSDVDAARSAIKTAAVILTQLETPLDTLAHLAEIAYAEKKLFILNPAPAAALPESVLKRVDILTPNEHEASLLTGLTVSTLSDASKAAQSLHKMGAKTVIITLGAEGALLLNEGIEQHVPAARVKAVDTTAAGDVFNGALAVALAEGWPMLEAVKFACSAAAISVTRKGAQTSAPYRNEIEI
jgi:ribokinase